MGFKVGAPVHAGEIVVDALQREGVRRIFCTPGSHVMPFYDGLRKAPSIELVTCKQEPNTSLMAEPYGRITGAPGVCLVTAGPGAGQLHCRYGAGLRRGVTGDSPERSGAAERRQGMFSRR